MKFSINWAIPRWNLATYIVQIEMPVIFNFNIISLFSRIVYHQIGRLDRNRKRGP